MKKIKKEDIFDFLKSNSKGCYICLKKLDDKKYVGKILGHGLSSNGSKTMGMIVDSMGVISTLKKEVIGDYLDNGIVLVLMIPIVFENSDKKRILGGIREYNKEVSLDSKGQIKYECITDYLFKDVIPREMIFGYLEIENDDVKFYDNEFYYGNMSLEDKDSFIDKYFTILGYDIDIDGDVLEEVRDSSIPFEYYDDIQRDIEYILNDMI